MNVIHTPHRLKHMLCVDHSQNWLLTSNKKNNTYQYQVSEFTGDIIVEWNCSKLSHHIVSIEHSPITDSIIALEYDALCGKMFLVSYSKWRPTHQNNSSVVKMKTYSTQFNEITTQPDSFSLSVSPLKSEVLVYSQDGMFDLWSISSSSPPICISSISHPTFEIFKYEEHFKFNMWHTSKACMVSQETLLIWNFEDFTPIEKSGINKQCNKEDIDKEMSVLYEELDRITTSPTIEVAQCGVNMCESKSNRDKVAYVGESGAPSIGNTLRLRSVYGDPHIEVLPIDKLHALVCTKYHACVYTLEGGGDMVLSFAWKCPLLAVTRSEVCVFGLTEAGVEAWSVSCDNGWYAEHVSTTPLERASPHCVKLELSKDFLWIHRVAPHCSDCGLLGVPMASLLPFGSLLDTLPHELMSDSELTDLLMCQTELLLESQCDDDTCDDTCDTSTQHVSLVKLGDYFKSLVDVCNSHRGRRYMPTPLATSLIAKRPKVYGLTLVQLVQRGHVEVVDVFRVLCMSCRVDCQVKKSELIMFSIYVLSLLISLESEDDGVRVSMCEHISELCFHLLETCEVDLDSVNSLRQSDSPVKWVALFCDIAFEHVISKDLLRFVLNSVFLAAYTNSKLTEEVASMETNKLELSSVIERGVKDNLHLHSTVKSLCLFASSQHCEVADVEGLIRLLLLVTQHVPDSHLIVFEYLDWISQGSIDRRKHSLTCLLRSQLNQAEDISMLGQGSTCYAHAMECFAHSLDLNCFLRSIPDTDNTAATQQLMISCCRRRG